MQRPMVMAKVKPSQMKHLPLMVKGWTRDVVLRRSRGHAKVLLASMAEFSVGINAEFSPWPPAFVHITCRTSKS